MVFRLQYVGILRSIFTNFVLFGEKRNILAINTLPICCAGWRLEFPTSPIIFCLLWVSTVLKTYEHTYPGITALPSTFIANTLDKPDRIEPTGRVVVEITSPLNYGRFHKYTRSGDDFLRCGGSNIAVEWNPRTWSGRGPSSLKQRRKPSVEVNFAL